MASILENEEEEEEDDEDDDVFVLDWSLGLDPV